jgi:starvation-inducible DNA-binding protein
MESTTTLYSTRNDLPESTRIQIVDLLNARLADAIDLMMQAKQAHWNVKGPSFIALHELFDKVYEGVAEYVDVLAERAVQLGGIAQGTVRAAATRSTLEEYPPEISDGSDHVDALRTVLATFGAEARLAIGEADMLGDADTADVFTEISRGIDKLLWFVEAHLQHKV